MNKDGIIDDCRTTPLFWDCECQADFIQPKNTIKCIICGAEQENQPDSRISEVRALLKKNHLTGGSDMNMPDNNQIIKADDIPCKYVCIRIDEELQAKLDTMRGNKKKSDFYRKILEEYAEEITNHRNQITYSDRENALLREDIQYLRSKLDEVTRLINNEQALHHHTQGLLPAPEP